MGSEKFLPVNWQKPQREVPPPDTSAGDRLAYRMPTSTFYNPFAIIFILINME